MLRKLIFFSILTVTACQGSAQSSSEGVIQRSLDSAKTRELGPLSILCTPFVEFRKRSPNSEGSFLLVIN